MLDERTDVVRERPLLARKAGSCLASAELRSRRLALGLSQAALARMFGVSPNTLARWERGELAIGSSGMLLLALDRLELLREPRTDHRQGASSQPTSTGSRQRISLLRVPRSDKAQTGHHQPTYHQAPCSLPAQPNRLIGRDQDLAAVQRLLQRDDVRLVTLTGPAGTGKTRLALEAAQTLQDAFPHGVFCVDLSPIRAAELVVTAIAQSLKIREDAGGRLLLESLKQSLRNRAVLLLLDNFEQVMTAVPHVSELLASCPALKILVTSRASLRLRWEHEYPVPPLALPDTTAPLRPEMLARSPAIALFVERAQAALPAFALDQTNASTVAEVCTRLDGLPLGIELAAARVKVLPPVMLLRHLVERREVLVAGHHDLPDRHQTLRAALDWSYELLAAEEQALFRQLGVFVGSFDLPAAEKVVAGFDLEKFASLVEKSLVQRLAGEEEAARFRLLQTVREDAFDRLAACGEAEGASRRHAAYYLALAERLAPDLRGASQLASLACLDREYDNLRAALQWHSEHADAAPMVRLCGAIWEFWWVRGYLRDARAWLERALAIGESESSPAKARVLNGLGLVASLCGDHDQGWRWMKESEAVWRALDDPRGLAHVLTDQGSWLQIHARNQAAVETLHESAALARGVGDRWETAYGLFSLGAAVRSEVGDKPAVAILEECRRIFRELGDNRGVAYAEMRLAEILADQGEALEAAAYARRALAAFQELRDTWGLIYSLVALGRATASLGYLSQAAWLFGVMESLCENTGAMLLPQQAAAVERELARARSSRPVQSVMTQRALGRAARLDQAIASALATPLDSSRRATAPDGCAGHSPLTPREREVALLVARGLANRQIAEALVISERTAEGHVERIRAKLQLRSRAELAAWVVEHQLNTACCGKERAGRPLAPGAVASAASPNSRSDSPRLSPAIAGSIHPRS